MPEDSFTSRFLAEPTPSTVEEVPYSTWSQDNIFEDPIESYSKYMDHIREQYVEAGEYNVDIEKSITQNFYGELVRQNLIDPNKLDDFKTVDTKIRKFELPDFEDQVENLYKEDLTKKGIRKILDEDERNLFKGYLADVQAGEEISEEQQNIVKETYRKKRNKILKQQFVRGEINAAVLEDDEGNFQFFGGHIPEGQSYMDVLRNAQAQGTGVRISDLPNLVAAQKKLPAFKNKTQAEVMRLTALAGEVQAHLKKDEGLKNKLAGLSRARVEAEDGFWDNTKDVAESALGFMFDIGTAVFGSDEAQANRNVQSAIKRYSNSVEITKESLKSELATLTGASDKDVEQVIDQLSIDQADFKFYEDDLKLNLREGIYKQPKIHTSLLHQPKLLDRAIAEADLDDEVAESLRASREIFAAEDYSRVNKLLQEDGDTADDWNEFYLNNKKEGIEDHKILEKFAEEYDFNGFVDKLEGIGYSLYSGTIGTAATIIGSITGIDTLREYGVEVITNEQKRRQVGGVFGVEYGSMYDLATTAVPMVTDMAATVFLSKFTAGVGGAVYAGAKASSVSAVRSIANNFVKGNLKLVGGETYKDVAQKLFKEGAIKNLDDAYGIVKNFNSVMAQRIGAAPAVFIPAASRSGANTYAAVNTLMTEKLTQDHKNADGSWQDGWSEERVKKEAHEKGISGMIYGGAFTGLLTAGFGLVGKGGFETAFLRNASYRQLKNVGERLLNREIADVVFVENLKKSFKTALAKQQLTGLSKITQGALSEGVEESIDEFANTLIQDIITSEATPMVDVLNQTFHAFFLGGVLGGGGVAVNRAAKTIAPDRFLDKKAAADFENEILEQYQRDVQGNKELIEAGAPLTAQAAAEYLSRYARTQPSAEQEAEKIIEPFVEDEVNEESEILNNDLNNIDRDEVENAFNEELEKSEKGKDPVDPEVAISEDAQQIIKENGLDVDEALGKILKPHYAPSPKEVQERYTEKEKDIKQRLETWEAVNRIKDPEKQQETKIALKQVGYNILNPSQAKAAVKKLRAQTERDLKAIEQAEKDGLTETDMHLVETLASEGVSKSLDQSTLKGLDVKPSKSDPAFIKVLEKKVKQRIKSKYPTRPVRLPEGGYEIPRGEGKSTLKVKSNGVGVFNNDPESMIALLQLGVPVEVDSVTEQTNPSFKWEQKGNKFILRDVVVRESGGMISATTSNNDVAVLEEDYTDLINDAKKLNELNQIDNPNLDVQIKSPFDRRRKATVRDLIEVSKDPLELKKLLAKSNTKVDDLDKPFFDSAVTYLSVQLQLRFRNYAEALGKGLAVDLNFTANSVASDVVEYLYKQQQARKDYQVRSTVESIDTDRTNKVDLNEDVDRTEMSEDTYVPVSFSSDPSLRDPSVIREYLTQQQDAAAAALESDPEMTQALRAAMTEAGHGYANQLSGEALFAAHVSELARTGNFNKQKSIYQFHSRLKAGEFDKGKVLSDSLFFLNLSHKFNRAADQSPTTKKEAAARVKEKLESITGKKILEPEAINFYTQVKKQINKFLQRGVADKRSRKAIEAANDSQVEELGLRDGSPDHVIKALEKIAKGKNKVQAIIARVLLHNRALLKTIDFTLEKSSATYAGKYFINNEGKGHVVINLSRTGGRGIADTLLHEYIHAFSSRITQLDPSQRTTAENNAIARLEGLLKIVRKQAAADKAPASIQAGLANVDEFISYFLTSPKFQGYIKSMTLKEGRSFFDRIIDAIARLFRQPTNEREYNAALRDVLDITKRGMLVREPDSSAGFRDQVAEGIEQSQKERDGISKLLSMEADIRDLEMLDEKAAELEIFVGNYVPSEVAVFSNNDIPTIARWNPQTQAIEFNGRRAAAFLNEALTNNGGYPINEEQVIGILINEELAHAASFASLSQDSINTIIDSMDDAQAKIVIEEYYPEDEQADALKRLESDDPQVVKNQKYILAEEMMRMFFQKKTRGTTSEEVVSFLIESPTNLEIFKQYLKNTFSRLSYHKEAKHISPEMRNGIKRVLNEVRRMEAGYRTRMNGMYFDTANPNATVNQLIDQLSRNKSLDFLEEDDIAPDLETRIGSTALITAPLRVDELRTLSKQEMVKRVDSAKYIHLQQAFDDIAEAYGLTVDTRSPLIGGYLEPVDKTDPDYEGKTEEELRQLATLSTEVPERVFVEGATEEELREIALLIKVLAPEVQHSTLIVKYQDEEAGAQEIEVRIKTKGAEKARMMAEDWLKDKNAGGFSYDPTTREINTLLLEPEEEGDPTVDEQLNTWNTFVDEQKQKGNIFKNAQSESTYVSTQFVGGKLEDVQAEVQRIRDKARQQDNAALLEVSERTLKRIDQEKDAEKIQSKAKKILEKRTLSPLSSKTIAKETKGKSFETIRDFGKFLDDRFESIEGVRQLSEQADEGIDDRAAKAAIPLVDDILTGLSESGSGKGWYDGRVQATLHELTKVYPELADSPNELAIFVGILATTSQGQKVVANFRFASQVYEDYKATGKIQSDYTQMGEAQGAINGNLKFMQDLIDRFQKETGLGKDEFTKFMDSEILGGALRDMFGKAPTGVTLKETVVGARMLGPKIGSFFNNLRRRFDTITMDLWYTRTMHRYIGNSVLENDAEAVVNAREKFIDALRVAERKYELDPEELETKDFEEVFSAAKQVFRVWASGKHPDAGGKTYKRYADGYEIEKAARTITTTSEMKKAPKNKSHSLFFERIVREAQSQLKDLGIDLNAADIQAILWFREKNLFKGLGLADSAAAPADYLDAAMVLRREKAQEVAPALETKVGGGVTVDDMISSVLKTIRNIESIQERSPVLYDLIDPSEAKEAARLIRQQLGFADPNDDVDKAANFIEGIDFYIDSQENPITSEGWEALLEASGIPSEILQMPEEIIPDYLAEGISIDEELDSEPVPPALETRFGAGKFPSDHKGLKNIIEGKKVGNATGIGKGMEGSRVNLSHTNITLGRLSRDTEGKNYDDNYPVGVMPYALEIGNRKFNAFNVRLKDSDNVNLSKSVYENFLKGGNKYKLSEDMTIEQLLTAVNVNRNTPTARIGETDLKLINPDIVGKDIIPKGTIIYAQGAKGVVGGPAGTLVSYNKDIKDVAAEGIYINDSTQKFTDQILKGEKTVETRNKPTLDRFIGQRVGIIRSGRGKSVVVGYATIGDRIDYPTEKSFRADEKRHKVKKGSKFDTKGVKYGYELLDVTEEPNPYGVVESKSRQHALIAHSIAYNPAQSNYMYPVYGTKEGPVFEVNKEFVGADEVIMISDLGKQTTDQGINFMLVARGARFKNLTDQQVKRKRSSNQITKFIKGRATPLEAPPKAPALETQFGASSYIPKSIGEADLDFSDMFESLDIPILEYGTFEQPSSTFKKALVGSTDRQVRRFIEERDAFVRTTKGIVKQFKDKFDKDIERIENKKNVTIPKSIISRATGSTVGSQLSQDQLDDVSDKFEKAIKAARKINDQATREAAFISAEEQRRKNITNYRQQNRDRLLEDRDKALKELSELTDNSPDVVQLIINARAFMDELSKKGNDLFSDYLSDFDVQATFDGNLGIYITRRYRMFEDDAFGDRVLTGTEYESVRNAALNFFSKVYFNQQVKYYMTEEGYSKKVARELASQDLDDANAMTVSPMQTMMEDFVNGYKSGDITGGVKTFVGSNQEEQIAISSTQNISKPLKAYLNQIKNKHDVPVELRNLLGEYGEEAGIDNILISIVSTSSMMANQAMLNKMAHYGMQGDNPWMVGATDILNEKEAAAAEGRRSKYEGWVPLRKSQGSMDWNPVSDMYVEQEVYDGLKEIFEKPSQKEAGAFGNQVFRAMQQATGLSLAAKTLGSVGFYVRNMVSNGLYFGPMQGYYGGIGLGMKEAGAVLGGISHIDRLNGPVGDYVKGLKEDSMLVRAYRGSRATMDAELEFLASQNVWGDEVQAEVIREFVEGKVTKKGIELKIQEVAEEIKRLAPKGIEKAPEKVASKVKGLAEFAARLASASDAYYKIGYYHFELAHLVEAAQKDAPDGKYRKLLKEDGTPSTEMKKMAALKVKRTSQAYSQAPPIIRKATSSALGLHVGAYVRFAGETVRIPFNTWQLSKEELADANPVIQARGKSRRKGMALVFGGFTVVIPQMMRMLIANMDLDEEEALRNTLPEYMRDHTFLYTTFGKGIQSWDLTYLNPFASITDGFIRGAEHLLKGNFGEAVESILLKTFKPFVEPQILAEALIQVGLNKNQYDKPIYYKDDPAIEQWAKRFLYVLDNAYGLRTMSKINETQIALRGEGEGFLNSPLGIIAAEFTPTRPHSVDLQANMRNFLNAKAKEYRDITTKFNRLYQDKAMTRGQVNSLYSDIQNSRRRLNETVFETMKNFESIGRKHGGITRSEIERQAKITGMSKERFRLGRMGYMKTLRPSPAQRKKLDSSALGRSRSNQLKQLQREFGDTIPLDN